MSDVIRSFAVTRALPALQSAVVSIPDRIAAVVPRGQLTSKAFMVLCVACAGYGIYVTFQSLAFTLRGMRAEAEVVSVVGDHKRLLFTSHIGDVEFTADLWYSRRFIALREGDFVPILYKRTNPKLARVDHWSELWVRPALLGAATLVALTLSLAFKG